MVGIEVFDWAIRTKLSVLACTKIGSRSVLVKDSLGINRRIVKLNYLGTVDPERSTMLLEGEYSQF